jgi:hypothetical protein
MKSIRYSCQVLIKRKLYQHIFEKFSYQNLRKYVQPDLSYSLRTDGHDEANCRFSQFCERA